MDSWSDKCLTNETFSKNLESLEINCQNEKLKEEYDCIAEEQLREGVIEEAPQNPLGNRIFYMPHMVEQRINCEV